MTKKYLWVKLPVLLILILGFCYLFRPFSVFLPEYNSAVDIITYSDIQAAPTEIRKILEKQTYPALYIENLKPNVYLLHDNQIIGGYSNIQLNASLRNGILNINIKKRGAGSEMDTTPRELIAIISVPYGKKIADIKVTQNLYEIFKGHYSRLY